MLAWIPYRGYWSTPFARWQGAFAHLHAMKFSAHVARAELDARQIDPAGFDFAAYGLTIGQHRSFYGLPGSRRCWARRIWRGLRSARPAPLVCG